MSGDKVTVRLSQEKKRDFMVVIARFGVKAQSLLAAFVDNVITYDENDKLGFGSKLMGSIVQRARTIEAEKRQ